MSLDEQPPEIIREIIDEPTQWLSVRNSKSFMWFGNFIRV